MKDLNARIQQLTKLILTSQTMDENMGDESRPASPSKANFNLSPYEVRSQSFPMGSQYIFPKLRFSCNKSFWRPETSSRRRPPKSSPSKLPSSRALHPHPTQMPTQTPNRTRTNSLPLKQPPSARLRLPSPLAHPLGARRTPSVNSSRSTKRRSVQDRRRRLGQRNSCGNWKGRRRRG